MRTIFVIGSIFLIFLVGQVIAAPTAKQLIDSYPGDGVLINLDQWFSVHPVREGYLTRSDAVFLSPRSSVDLTISRDLKPVLGRHIHLTTDEIIVVHKGEGEMYINGQWTPVKAGDLHICPRGVAHAVRALPGKELWYVSIFTPPQPKGSHDRVMIDE